MCQKNPIIFKIAGSKYTSIKIDVQDIMYLTDD